MGKINIVTDSTADLPESLIKELNITVVPLKVSFGDKVYREGIDISAKTFFEKLGQSTELPRTSQPSPGEFQEIYRELACDGSSIISIHLSSHLSGTCQSAQLAKSSLPHLDITVVDSKQVSMGLGMIVLAAARAAKDGKTEIEILASIEKIIRKMQTYIVVDTLEYLKKGGRIGKASALMGTVLNIKPILTIEDGIITPFEKTRGKAKAIERIIELVKEFSDKNGLIRSAIVHADALDEAVDLHGKLITGIKYCELIISEIGAVVGTHGGPGTIVVFLYEDLAQA